MNNYLDWSKMSLKDKLKFSVSIVCVILFIAFAALNWNSQEIHFIFLKSRIPLTIAIFLSVVVGYLISFLFSYKKLMKKDFEIEMLKEKIESIKSQLSSAIKTSFFKLKLEINSLDRYPKYPTEFLFINTSIPFFIMVFCDDL